MTSLEYKYIFNLAKHGPKASEKKSLPVPVYVKITQISVRLLDLPQVTS